MIIKVKPISAINNSPDQNGYGGVSYGFFMSETPVSNELYCEFLNDNRHKTHIKNHHDIFQPDIIYQNNIFIPKDKLTAQYPITNISYFDAQSFILWLNKLDKYFTYYIPSLNEWYKAAYYDPINKNYTNFPNRTNELNEITKDPTAMHNMNIENIFNKKLKNKYHIFNYSHFNIRDMGGNIYEIINHSGHECIIAGSSWNRNRLNAHKDNCGTRKINKKYKSNYIGIRLCKRCKPINLFVSLHNDFGDGWKGDKISIYDTNQGILCNDLTLQHGYDSDLHPLSLYPFTDTIIIIEYISKHELFYENSIKIYNSHKQIIYQYNFKQKHTKKIIDLDLPK